MSNWRYKIDVTKYFDPKNKFPVQELAKGIATIFRENITRDKFLSESEVVEIAILLDELENEIDETSTEDDFDAIWDNIYDWADNYRIWIQAR